MKSVYIVALGKNLTRSLCAATLLLASWPSFAADLIVNGSAIFSELGKQQFVASLYLEAPSKATDLILYQDRPKKMEVRMLANYPEHRWFNLWMQSISINNSRDSLAGVAKDLIGLIKAPKAGPETGDIIEFAYQPGSGTSIIYNGSTLTTKPSKELFEVLLKTWVGPVPPSTDFKSQILGETSNASATAMLSTIKPSSERIKLAATWIKDDADTTNALAKTDKAQDKGTAKGEENITADGKSSDQEAEKLAAAKKEEDDKARKAKEMADKKAAEESAALAAKKAEEEAREQAEALSAMAQLDYTPQVVSKIFKSVSYPSKAVQRSQEGTVRVMVTINREGQVVDAVATEESEYSLLNNAALSAIKRASPFPKLPQDFLGDSFEVTVPISFRLQ